jgi:mannosyltransferase
VGRPGSNDQAGIIVPLEATESAADAAVALLSDPNRHSAFASAAHQRAHRLFSVAKEAAGIAAVYDRLWSR